MSKFYTTQLQAGLGLIEETKSLFELWQPGIKIPELFDLALKSGYFGKVSARRLRNIVAECFAPRYLGAKDYPVFLIKELIGHLSTPEIIQLFLLYTARANSILADFIRNVYWNRYSSGYQELNNTDAIDFVVRSNQEGKTVKTWSDSTIKKVSSYLTGCCADFGLLESGRKSNRKILSFRPESKVVAILAYDLHFSGLGDNAVISHTDWQLFGLQPEDVRDEFKKLSLKGFFIMQAAGEVTRISWNYKNWENLINVISKS